MLEICANISTFEKLQDLNYLQFQVPQIKGSETRLLFSDNNRSTSMSRKEKESHWQIGRENIKHNLTKLKRNNKKWPQIKINKSAFSSKI